MLWRGRFHVTLEEDSREVARALAATESMWRKGRVPARRDRAKLATSRAVEAPRVRNGGISRTLWRRRRHHADGRAVQCLKNASTEADAPLSPRLFQRNPPAADSGESCGVLGVVIDTEDLLEQIDAHVSADFAYSLPLTPLTEPEWSRVCCRDRCELLH
jgi:hypothetical protein